MQLNALVCVLFHGEGGEKRDPKGFDGVPNREGRFEGFHGLFSEEKRLERQGESLNDGLLIEEKRPVMSGV